MVAMFVPEDIEQAAGTNRLLEQDGFNIVSPFHMLLMIEEATLQASTE